MKIFKLGVVFVQLTDIESLRSLSDDIPDFVDREYTVVTTDKDSGKSFIKYETQQAIDFWREQDWVLDYSEVENLSLADLRQLKSTIRGKFLGSKTSNKGLHGANLSPHQKGALIKLAAIDAIYYRKAGLSNWDLPDGIKIPTPKAPRKSKKKRP